MAQQVKFYAVTAAQMEAKISAYVSGTTSAINQGGIYFITDTKKIYKGSEPYGLAQVFKADSSTAGASTASDFVSAAATGDILFGDGNVKVFDGTSFIDISVSAPTLTASTTDGTLVYDDSDVAIPGWDKVSNVITASTVDDETTYTVTADTGIFENLTVNDTATFTATTIDASTIATSSITVNGSTIDQIANARISAIVEATASATSNGVTVSVVTQSGSIKEVQVTAPEMVSAIASSNASDEKVATEKAIKTYVDTAISNLGTVLDFKGTTLTLPEEGNSVGDIYVIKTAGEGETLGEGLVAGQEYLYTSNGWELVGDNTTVASLTTTATTTATSVATLMGGSSTTGSVDNKIAAAISSAELVWLGAE